MSQFSTLLAGAAVTLEVSFLATLLGALVGVVVAVLFQTKFSSLRFVIRLYVSFARGTPLFIQILIVYFLLPRVGLDVSRFYAGVIALAFNSGAYISEMIRGAITMVPRGQIEAARALAMPRRLIWAHIILPQVFTLILPPLTVEFAAVLKGSALLSVIGLVELTRTAQQVIGYTFKPIGVWLQVGGLYFVMCCLLALATQHVQRLTVAERPREVF
jgi:His/Glu/Gln/Arg/opine family amino acid ABC transporter permease subunit